MLNFLAQTTIPASQIVRDAHTFYSDAFGDLLMVAAIFMVFLTIAVGLIGVVLPWWLERQRRQKFELSKQEVLAEIGRAQADFQEEHKKLLADIRKTEGDLREDIDHGMEEVIADTQFGVAMAQKEPFSRALHLSQALRFAARAGRKGKFEIALSVLEDYVRDEAARIVGIAENLEILVAELERLMDAIKKVGWKEKYDSRIQDLINLLRQGQPETGKDKEDGDQDAAEENDAGQD